ncbi:MAG: hypothetical protein ACE5HF_08140 [Gemmatimonadota bacterium]
MRQATASGRTGWGRRGLFGALLAGAALGAGCGGDSGPLGPNPPPGPKPQAQLTFLRPDAAAPALQTTDTSFVATRGVGQKVEIFYAPLPGQSSGEEFLEFELKDRSLRQYPPGHPKAGQTFANGDTITITIRVDSGLLGATLEPSGLLFDPANPAELEIRYQNADPDFDDDGLPDPELEGEIDLWRQEKPGDLWEPVGRIKDLELDRIRAFLDGFSRYALAF